MVESPLLGKLKEEVFVRAKVSSFAVTLNFLSKLISDSFRFGFVGSSVMIKGSGLVLFRGVHGMGVSVGR